TQPVLHGPFTALAHEPDTVTDENRFGDHGRAAPLMHGGRSFPERVDEKVCSSHKPFRTPGWGTGPGQGRETPGRPPGGCVSAGPAAPLWTPPAARACPRPVDQLRSGGAAADVTPANMVRPAPRDSRQPPGHRLVTREADQAPARRRRPTIRQ